MRIYRQINHPTLEWIGQIQKTKALACGGYLGRGVDDWLLEDCKFYIAPLGALGIFTLDTGMHTCGWWKNPDYERCFHLSLSFLDPEAGIPAPHNHKVAARVVHGMYGVFRHLVWTEPPYDKAGKDTDTWHYRVFVDVATGIPILPRGEVYTRELTEAGWKSFSEVQAIEKRQG